MTANLDQLRAELMQLINDRNAALDAARQRMDEANQRFDTAAKPIAREINRLETEERKSIQTTKQRTRKPAAIDLDGMSDEAVALYRELREN